MNALRPVAASGIEVAPWCAAAHGAYLDCYTFLAVHHGALSLRYRRVTMMARAGDLILLEPGRTLVTDMSAEHSARATALCADPSTLEGLAARAQAVTIAFDAAVVSSPLAQSIGALVAGYDATRDAAGDGYTAISAAVREVVAVHGTALPRGACDDRPCGIAAAAYRAAAYLHSHVADPVSLDTLARVACMSKYHLTRVFHGFYGLPPHAYQLQLRLAFAKRLISRGLSVAAAARAAGFAGAVHMHRHFRARYGAPPSCYAATQKGTHLTPQLLARLADLPLRD